MTTKSWGPEAFWGLDYNFAPQWVLTPAQQKLQAKMIDLCATTLRPNAVESDENLAYPRKNFEALASLGLLGLLVPKKWGGLGENHTCAAMVVEAIARYGCPSTAMCYTMHLCATAAALFRAEHNLELQKVLQRLDRDVFISTLSYSDPETGSHFWYPACFFQSRKSSHRLASHKKSFMDNFSRICRLVHCANYQSRI
ncbi:acyl-CoA dehydrogenase family protein [Chroogloeocystis siderophila]|uniref:acyl-CoA dehydrogenase family protein n=1 Tax=Chroogloeocystis siderophila TaxID=329163 RepID=UPI001C49E00F|nr:acyl-CoA dehydrogenase family protein [Chroogloeocystis siderophila]